MTPVSRDYDTTGWCDRGQHDCCDGMLHAATGYHWWCVCTCHPVPTVTDATDAHREALETFKAARAHALQALTDQAEETR